MSLNPGEKDYQILLETGDEESEKNYIYTPLKSNSKIVKSEGISAWGEINTNHILGSLQKTHRSSLKQHTPNISIYINEIDSKRRKRILRSSKSRIHEPKKNLEKFKILKPKLSSRSKTSMLLPEDLYKEYYPRKHYNSARIDNNSQSKGKNMKEINKSLVNQENSLDNLNPEKIMQTSKKC